MPTSVGRIGIDEVSFRGEGKGLPEILALKLPIHGVKDSGSFGNLVRDLRDVGPSEPTRLATERDVELPLAVEAHNAVKTRTIQKYEG